MQIRNMQMNIFFLNHNMLSISFHLNPNLAFYGNGQFSHTTHNLARIRQQYLKSTENFTQENIDQTSPVKNMIKWTLAQSKHD